jgi:hypothetical protein
MTDLTAGRSAGTPQNPLYDPTRSREDDAPPEARRDPTSASGDPTEVLTDTTAGRSAGTPQNPLYDPTRSRKDDAPPEARRDPTSAKPPAT